MTAKKQTCPRRIHEVGPWEYKEDLDSWETGGGLVGRQEEVERSCSFCGSLHPDTFMDWVRQGAEVGPTDKTYKAYIKYPGNDPREGEESQFTIEGARGPIPVTTVYGTTAKFYYQHLSDDQRREFIELYNNKTMRLGYPGHFYALPFFVTWAPRPGGEDGA